MHELTITGPCPARRMLLENGEHLIGRVPDSAIHLDGEGISREHARLEVQGGDAYIVDLDSMNGTLVAGQSIVRKRLDDGDVISIGGYRLLYRQTTDPADVTEVSELEESSSRGLAVAVPVPVRMQEPETEDADSEAKPVPSRKAAPGRLRALEPPRWAGSSGSEPGGVQVTEAPDDTPQVTRQRPPAPRLALGSPPPESAAVQADPAAVPGDRRVRMNFRGRLAVALLGLVFLAVLFTGYGVTALAEEMMAMEAQSRARTLTYLLSEMNLSKLRSGDARLITEPFVKEAGVRRALVLDENGAVVSPESARGQTDPLLRAAQASDKFERQITPDGAILSVPILSGGRRYGTAVIDFSVEYLKQKSAHMGKLSLMVGLFLGALALLCSGILERMAHKPFLALASEVDLVVKGNLMSEVPLTTDGKANQLCEALNRLIRRVGERRNGEGEAPAVTRSQVGDSIGLLEELLEVVGDGLLVVAEDGTLQLCNDAAADLLDCDVAEIPNEHLLDALSESPCLNELLALVKDSRQAPGKTLQRRFRGQDIEARARTLPGDRSQPTLIVLERPA